MPNAAAPQAAVSVRYAREQYALGYAHGRAGSDDRTDAAAFSRFFLARCEHAGGLVDVADAYREWQTEVTAP